MSPGAALVASFLVVLARPETWPLALATFLLRGGILVVLAPIVVIPSAVGVANVIGPMLTSFVFGGASTDLVIVIVAAVMGLVGWIVLGGLLAAAAEAAGVGIVASDEEVEAVIGAAPTGAAPTADREPSALVVARRILVARLIAHLPMLLALAWGAFRIVTVTYRELTLPSEVISPVVVRVIRAAPDAVALLLVTWILGEVVGSVAARRVVQGGDGVSAALGAALRRVVRHPLRTAILTLIPLVALLAVLVPNAAAAAASWTALRASLATGGGFLPAFAALGVFVVLWLGGLVVLAVIAAWRAAAWTVEVAGTFGGSAPDRPGGWNDVDESGTLTDLRPGESIRIRGER